MDVYVSCGCGEMVKVPPRYVDATHRKVEEYYELHQTPLRDLQDENARLRARLVDISKCSSGYYSDFSSHLQQLAEDALEIQ